MLSDPSVIGPRNGMLASSGRILDFRKRSKGAERHQQIVDSLRVSDSNVIPKLTKGRNGMRDGMQSMEKEKTTDLLALTDEERLLRHNLETRKYWSEKDLELTEGRVRPYHRTIIPPAWEMTKGIKLYDWQEECVSRWLQDRRGTIKVVTGAGKTVLALAIIERLQAQNPDLYVAIVVPTIVLQEQWYKAILRNSNLPASALGRLGGGHSDAYKGDVRILLCVLKSASERLPALVKKTRVGTNLLLVVDECHRAGSPDMSKVFRTERAYNLGLSATPEREDHLEYGIGDEDQQYNTSLLGRELGPIIYEMNVQEALTQGILPKFEIHHYGLPLSEVERERYESLSRRLRDVTTELREVGHQHGFHDTNITRRAQSLVDRDDQLGIVARQYIALVNERKRLLYNADLRSRATIEILKERFRKNPDTRAILFHESIESVMQLYYELLQQGFPVTVEHSMLTEGLREESIALFRQGIAKIILSAKSLIEGFNVPETDIAIIVASSASVRQRIQTIGRVLRRSKDSDKIATIYVLYMHDTVDEVIYGKADWDNLLGAQRNRYFLWSKEGALVEQERAPRAPLPSEDDISLDFLQIGDEYPGAYEGVEYSCDSDGNVFTANRELVLNPQGVPEAVRRVKGRFGRFKVTPRKRYILALVSDGDDWVVKFVGELREPFKTSTRQNTQSGLDVHQLKTGDPFPHEFVGADYQTIYFKQSGGRAVLAKREGKGEVFARVGELATDREKGDDAERLLRVCNEYKRVYTQLNKLIVTNSRHVLFLKDGTYHYLSTLTSGLEFS
jgi:superfamily II DNA or RNA helicase